MGDRRGTGASRNEACMGGGPMKARLGKVGFVSAVFVMLPAVVAAQRVCFRGVPRPACSGFVLFEGTAAASGGSSEFTINTTTAPVGGTDWAISPNARAARPTT